MANGYYFHVDPPAKWRAGFTGAGENAKPFYFHCCQCDKDIEIAGVISTRPDRANFEDIGLVMVGSGPFVNPAMYCADCWREKLAGATR